MLVGIPSMLLVCILISFFAIGWAILSKTVGEGLLPFEFMAQYAWMIQMLVMILCSAMVLLMASLQPTFVRAIAYVCMAFIAFFFFCGLVVCPFIFPLVFPDRTGRAAQVWMFCGYVKCIGFIGYLTLSLCKKTPRECLSALEYASCGAIAGVGILTAVACYFTVLDNMGSSAIPDDFWHGWAVMVVVTVLEGWLCVTNVPRNAGKWVLKALPSLWGGAAGTYEHQVLGATIAIMIGRDSGFREIMEKAVGSLRSVSLSDVTWEEFEKNLPDPKCYEKSKPAAFKDIDFFVSHSWSDDPKAKWAALQGVRRRFVLEHEREPNIWFDKYCIDQNAIDESVRRLPIFVVASQKMLVLLGHSYATRCWCMLELFVFSCCQRVGLFTDDHLIVEPLAVSPQARSVPP
eukprot:COSAG04_NODE_585_length_12348_cov_17.357907_5_plen_403_part_00